MHPDRDDPRSHHPDDIADQLAALRYQRTQVAVELEIARHFFDPDVLAREKHLIARAMTGPGVWGAEADELDDLLARAAARRWWTSNVDDPPPAA